MTKFNTTIKNYSKEIIAGIIFLVAYIPTFIWMWGRWFSRDSYYSHGILVPFVSGYLIWLVRKDLKNIRREESPWGLRLIIFGVVVHLLSVILRVYFTSGFSMLIVLVGLVLHFFGGKILRKVLFPVFFLFFMIPLPLVVIANLSFKLKMFAAEIAKILLNQMNIPAIRVGSVIKMQSAQVVVDDVCSGLRSLISLTALGSIFAYWMKSGLLKRVIVFSSTIPIAIITNVCRVIFLAAVSEIWGAEYADGFVHDVSGFMVFALAFVLLYAVGKLVE